MPRRAPGPGSGAECPSSWETGRGRKGGRPLARHAPHVRGEPGAKPFVDDLLLGRGFVRSRAAPSLRSIESQPSTQGFVRARARARGGPGGACASGAVRPSVRLPSSFPASPADHGRGRRGGREGARPRSARPASSVPASSPFTAGAARPLRAGTGPGERVGGNRGGGRAEPGPWPAGPRPGGVGRAGPGGAATSGFRPSRVLPPLSSARVDQQTAGGGRRAARPPGASPRPARLRSPPLPGRNLRGRPAAARELRT